MKKNMKIYEGTIITCDKDDHVYRYLVEDAGKILYVGNEVPEEYRKAPGMKLGDRALIPAFADTHIHFASYAAFHAGLNVMDAESNEEILEMLGNFAKTCKDKLIIGFGASPYSVKEGTLVTREQMDRVCPDKPVFMVKYDGHTCVVNTKLLEQVQKKVEHLRGYHPDTGEMNQDAFFAVSDHVTNSIPIPKLLKNMQKAVDDMAAKGIGMIHTVSGVGFVQDLDVDLERWFARGLDNGMQLRVFMQTLDVKKAKRRKLPRIGGCFEAALDGCFGSVDAAMLEPYENSDDKGVLYYSDEKVIDFCKKANRAGLQIELHAIGDAAFKQATEAIKAALDDYPREDHRHGIIHACLPTKEGIEICEKYGIQLPVQSAFINWPQEPDERLEEILGERNARLNPFRDFQDHSVVLSFGSDGPCTEPDPLNWIYKACNHNVPEQALTVQEALKMCTYNGYYSTFDEKKRGSLEAGKIADMVILSENPLAVEKERLNEVKVERLLLQGRPYKKISQNPIAQIIKGIVRKEGC